MVRPPSRPSSGAQTIVRALGQQAKLSRREQPLAQYRTIINWGGTAGILVSATMRMLNKPTAVATAVDKLKALTQLKERGVRVPEFQTEKPHVGKSIWLARTNLRGSGGEGIVVLRKDAAVPDAPLYVKYVPKLVEYRIHVVNGQVIFAQQKKRKSNTEQTDDQKLIRNHANGWVFCPLDVGDVSEDAKNVAVAAVAGLDLDFGAVDLVIGKSDGLAYVLECNTAPGLESEGLINAYSSAFIAIAGGT